jgi:hypothetical protein
VAKGRMMWASKVFGDLAAGMARAAGRLSHACLHEGIEP